MRTPVRHGTPELFVSAPRGRFIRFEASQPILGAAQHAAQTLQSPQTVLRLLALSVGSDSPSGLFRQHTGLTLLFRRDLPLTLLLGQAIGLPLALPGIELGLTDLTVPALLHLSAPLLRFVDLPLQLGGSLHLTTVLLGDGLAHLRRHRRLIALPSVGGEGLKQRRADLGLKDLEALARPCESHVIGELGLECLTALTLDRGSGSRWIEVGLDGIAGVAKLDPGDDPARALRRDTTDVRCANVQGFERHPFARLHRQQDGGKQEAEAIDAAGWRLILRIAGIGRKRRSDLREFAGGDLPAGEVVEDRTLSGCGRA